jgi:transcriptional regulator GlxA family with amidase domain
VVPVHRIAFLTFDRFNLLDLAGPLEVLHTATLVGGAPAGRPVAVGATADGAAARGYQTLVATLDGAPVRSSSGVTVTPDVALADCGPLDTLVVVGGLGWSAAADDPRMCEAVAAAAGRAGRTASVCTGALVLAAAGLLDGYQATTHWSSCADLAARYPAVDVLADRIYVHDRDRWTSAGVSAGIDLFLAVVEDDCGRAVAHQVAGWLVVFVQRPGGQGQFSAQLQAEPAGTPAIGDLQRWLPDHLTDDLTVTTMARRARMSPRSFARAFRAETGTTPAAYVEALRVEAARRLLESTNLTVAAVAGSVGMRRPETLYRAFRRRLGTTPDSYRQHFGHRGEARPALAAVTPLGPALTA